MVPVNLASTCEPGAADLRIECERPLHRIFRGDGKRSQGEERNQQVDDTYQSAFAEAVMPAI